jgi:hypothetical protein
MNYWPGLINVSHLRLCDWIRLNQQTHPPLISFHIKAAQKKETTFITLPFVLMLLGICWRMLMEDRVYSISSTAA